MKCCGEWMWKYERMAISLESEGVPEFVWYCQNCDRLVIDE